MFEEDKWNDFLKNGSVLAYLSYAKSKDKAAGSEKKYENTNTGFSDKGNQCR